MTDPLALPASTQGTVTVTARRAHGRHARRERREREPCDAIMELLRPEAARVHPLKVATVDVGN
jgi:hypothetical protein